MATLADLLGATVTPAKQPIIEKFKADLLRAAQINGAVDNPPGLNAEEADSVRRQVLSDFYANRTPQQIKEPMDMAQAALAYRVNKGLDPKIEAYLNRRPGPAPEPVQGRGFIPSIPMGMGAGLAQIVVGSLPAATPRFGLAQMMAGLPAVSSPRISYARELAQGQTVQPGMIGRAVTSFTQPQSFQSGMLGRGLPATSPTPSAPVSSSYTIKSGDTLTSIAARTGQSVASIAAKNGITDPNKIYAGATLKL